MDILQLIDRLEELFNESKSIPLTRNVMVDEDRMLDIIDQMRIAIPEEVKKAQQLLGQRDRVMAQAQEEANRTLEIARDKADQLVQKDNIALEAQRRAEQIVNQARADAEATRRDADEYVIDTLSRLQDELDRSLNQVRNGIRTLEDERMRRATPAASVPASIPAQEKSEDN
jgi:Mg/Co/Ni transporter MgtE